MNNTQTTERDMATNKRLMAIVRRAAKFGSQKNAESWAYVICTTPQRVIMGDVGTYLVVGPADAERLVRAGYEYSRS